MLLLIHEHFTKESTYNEAKSFGGTILNVGAGYMYVSDEQITSCDISYINGYCDLTTGLPYNDNSFDYVFASHVLEHVPPDKLLFAINECKRIARAKVFVVIPPPWSLVGRLLKKHHIDSLNYLWELKNKDPKLDIRY